MSTDDTIPKEMDREMRVHRVRFGTLSWPRTKSPATQLRWTETLGPTHPLVTVVTVPSKFIHGSGLGLGGRDGARAAPEGAGGAPEGAGAATETRGPALTWSRAPPSPALTPGAARGRSGPRGALSSPGAPRDWLPLDP